jgi:hydroxyethylthiazole kinase-like uncharacterized protein yjeF
MMEAAGKGLAGVIQRRFGDLPEKRITALIGSGNNGGDALVALDYLLSWGWQTSALILRDRSPQDPLLNRVREGGGSVLVCSEFAKSQESILNELNSANLVLDGVLGTGIKLPIKKPLSQLLGFVQQVLNNLDKKPFIIAVDCPSGIDCDTGEAAQSCFKADLTVTVNYPGAAILAGESAYRSGVGLVTIAVPKSIYSGVIGTLLEATWIQLDDMDGSISSSAIEQIKGSLNRPTACLIGPGLGTNFSSRDFLYKVLRLDDLPPLVLDADGLRLAMDTKKWPELLPTGSVLTPHPGEMAYLTGLDVEEIQAERVAIAEKYAQKWQQILVLKGAHTVIADPGGQTKILESAQPELARAGSGDILAGIITGLIAQGVPQFEAAAAGAWIHARAGFIAAEKRGSSASVIAGEISDAVGIVLQE